VSITQPAKPKAGILSTLQRGLRLLEAIAEDGGEATAKGLSERTGIRLGTCYHLLRTLQEEGYVVRFPGGRYALGGQLAFLYESLRRRLAPTPEVVEILRGLHARLDETSYVAGWYGDEIALQRHFEGKQAVAVRGLEVGYRDNPHARASCKSILAALPEERVREYLAPRGLTRLTANTITDLDSFLEHLRAGAARGYAVDREEFCRGVCCVSAAFLDRRSTPVGSFTISVPTARFDEKLDQLVEALLDAAHEASTLQGYTGLLQTPGGALERRRSRSKGRRPARIRA
jgi:IclR family acetate operon transcriptional repressor